MKINLSLRLQNKAFWVAIVPAILTLVRVVGKLFGYDIQTEMFGENIAAVIDAIFAVLFVLGIVADPTTPGINDSERALNREVLGEN